MRVSASPRAETSWSLLARCTCLALRDVSSGDEPVDDINGGLHREREGQGGGEGG